MLKSLLVYLDVVATTLMTAPFDATDMSLVSSNDGDSLPSFFFTLPMGNRDSPSAVPSSLGRESLERRRNRQTKEHDKVLGMLESMDDDESYVESTLASLEYSTTNTTLMFQDIVDSTAPYHMPQWRFKLKRWTNKIITDVMHRRLLSKYGPWVTVLVVFATCRLAWHRPSLQMLTSDTDRITLHSYREAMMHQDLSAGMSRRSETNGILTQPERLVGKNRDKRTTGADSIASQKVLQRYRVDMEKPHDEDPMSLAHNEKKRRKHAAQHQQTRQQNIPNQGDKDWGDFQGRVVKLKELSEKGYASPTSGIGPVAQFLSQQQQQQQHQPIVEKTVPARKQSHHRHEPQEQKELSNTKREGDIYWKPRKTNAKKADPIGLISADLI